MDAMDVVTLINRELDGSIEIAVGYFYRRRAGLCDLQAACGPYGVADSNPRLREAVGAEACC